METETMIVAGFLTAMILGGLVWGLTRDIAEPDPDGLCGLIIAAVAASGLLIVWLRLPPDQGKGVETPIALGLFAGVIAVVNAIAPATVEDDDDRCGDFPYWEEAHDLDE